MDLPRFNDLFQIGARQVLVLNGQVSVAAVNRQGSDINIDVSAAAAIGDECIGQLTNVASGLFIDSAQGTLLDRVLYDRYGLLRNTAAPALGSVNFQVVNGNNVPILNPGTFAIPANTVLQANTGEQFITTNNAVYVLNSPGPLVVAVQSILAGSNQQAAANTINQIVGAITGGPAAPNQLLVNNPLATAGAADDELDPAFRARGRAFFATARRGTIDAIVQGALAVAGVVSASAFEVIDGFGRPARYVQLVIADAFTNALANTSSVPPTYQAQSQQLALNVFAALSNVRAGGIYVQVTVGQVVLQPVLLALSFAAGSNVDQAALNARSAVTLYTNSLAPGVVWSRKAAQAAVAAIPGLVITGNEIYSPSGDVTPNPLQIIRTSLNLVTAAAVGTNVVLTSNQSTLVA